MIQMCSCSFVLAQPSGPHDRSLHLRLTHIEFESHVCAQPPAYAGAYQGFPQYCYSPAFNGTACWVGGGLCTSNPNATQQSFSQGAYETCMRQQQTTQCLVRSPSF